MSGWVEVTDLGAESVLPGEAVEAGDLAEAERTPPLDRLEQTMRTPRLDLSHRSGNEAGLH